MIKKRLQVYITPEADDLLREKAKTDHRSISATVEILILSAELILRVLDDENHSKKI